MASRSSSSNVAEDAHDSSSGRPSIATLISEIGNDLKGVMECHIELMRAQFFESLEALVRALLFQLAAIAALLVGGIVGTLALARAILDYHPEIAEWKVLAALTLLWCGLALGAGVFAANKFRRLLRGEN